MLSPQTEDEWRECQRALADFRDSRKRALLAPGEKLHAESVYPMSTWEFEESRKLLLDMRAGSKPLPINVDPKTEDSIREWISSRGPSDKFDGTVNSCSRWQFTIVDHGIFSSVLVTDLDNGETFSPEMDPSKF